jgi:hypothetical protein
VTRRWLYLACLWAGHAARQASDELADAATLLENAAADLAPFEVTRP